MICKGFGVAQTVGPEPAVLSGFSPIDECQRRKFSAKEPEDMLKSGSVTSMGLPKYLLIFFSINAENRVIIHERITICSQKHDPDILHLSVHRHRLWRIDE